MKIYFVSVMTFVAVSYSLMFQGNTIPEFGNNKRNVPASYAEMVEKTLDLADNQASKVNLSFQVQARDGAQEKQLAIMVSPDFSGKYTPEAIKAATWIDVSDRFNLDLDKDNRDFVNAGNKDIADVLPKGKPFYIAFKYVTRPQAEAGRYRIWRFNNFQLRDGDGQVLAKPLPAEWTLMNFGKTEPNRSVAQGSAIVFRGNMKNTEVHTETWAVSKPFLVSK